MDGILINEAFLKRFRISIDDMFGKPLENRNGRTRRLSYPDKAQQASSMWPVGPKFLGRRQRDCVAWTVNR